ncbi:hypothetical protein HDU96_006678 [Phlyctochytrium bullatum]|nr:hypothetical protein HDU96_006678 [Phlyctochytrium bullatum]
MLPVGTAGFGSMAGMHHHQQQQQHHQQQQHQQQLNLQQQQHQQSFQQFPSPPSPSSLSSVPFPSSNPFAVGGPTRLPAPEMTLSPTQIITLPLQNFTLSANSSHPQQRFDHHQQQQQQLEHHNPQMFFGNKAPEGMFLADNPAMQGMDAEALFASLEHHPQNSSLLQQHQPQGFGSIGPGMMSLEAAAQNMHAFSTAASTTLASNPHTSTAATLPSPPTTSSVSLLESTIAATGMDFTSLLSNPLSSLDMVQAFGGSDTLPPTTVAGGGGGGSIMPVAPAPIVPSAGSSLHAMFDAGDGGITSRPLNGMPSGLPPRWQPSLAGSAAANRPRGYSQPSPAGSAALSSLLREFSMQEASFSAQQPQQQQCGGQAFLNNAFATTMQGAAQPSSAGRLTIDTAMLTGVAGANSNGATSAPLNPTHPLGFPGLPGGLPLSQPPAAGAGPRGPASAGLDGPGQRMHLPAHLQPPPPAGAAARHLATTSRMRSVSMSAANGAPLRAQVGLARGSPLVPSSSTTGAMMTASPVTPTGPTAGNPFAMPSPPQNAVRTRSLSFHGGAAAGARQHALPNAFVGAGGSVRLDDPARGLVAMARAEDGDGEEENGAATGAATGMEVEGGDKRVRVSPRLAGAATAGVTTKRRSASTSSGASSGAGPASPKTVGAMSPPTGVTGAPATPASGGGNGKKTCVEAEAKCRVCGVVTGVLLLHGTPDALAKPHAVDLLCAGCQAANAAAAGGEAGQPTGKAGRKGGKKRSTSPGPVVEEAGEKVAARKRKRKGFGPTHPLDCGICSTLVGVGGVRSVVGEGTGVGEEGAAWVEPEFGVEPFCARCIADFKFCTNCGGGGQWRSGKWRPKELFLPGRKNCSLNHIRVGAPSTHRYIVFRCPVHTAGSASSPSAAGTPPFPSLDPVLIEALPPSSSASSLGAAAGSAEQVSELAGIGGDARGAGHPGAGGGGGGQQGTRFLRLRSLSASAAAAAEWGASAAAGPGDGTVPLPHSTKPYVDAIEDLVADALECWKAAFLHAYAEASVMRAKGSAHDTFAKLSMFMEVSVRNMALFLRGQFLPSREAWAKERTFKRYLALTYIPDPRSRKRAVSAPPVPGNLLGGVGGVSGTGGGAMGESMSMPGYVVAGFAALEWNVSDRHVWLQELGCLGQQGLSGNSMIPAMFNALEERMQDDLRAGEVAAVSAVAEAGVQGAAAAGMGGGALVLGSTVSPLHGLGGLMERQHLPMVRSNSQLFQMQQQQQQMMGSGGQQAYPLLQQHPQHQKLFQEMVVGGGGASLPSPSLAPGNTASGTSFGTGNPLHTPSPSQSPVQNPAMPATGPTLLPPPLYLWSYHQPRYGTAKDRMVGAFYQQGFRAIPEFCETHGLDAEHAAENLFVDHLVENFRMSSYHVMVVLYERRPRFGDAPLAAAAAAAAQGGAMAEGVGEEMDVKTALRA